MSLQLFAYKFGAMISGDAREILIVINGTVGVGKTSTSKYLADEIEGAVNIEGDSLGFLSPTNDHVLRAAIDLISKHRKAGVKVIIFDLFFDDEQKLDWFISQGGIKSHVFYLSATEEDLSNRIRQRAGPRADAELLDSKRVQRNQKSMKNRGVELDTTGKSPVEIAAAIKKCIFR